MKLVAQSSRVQPSRTHSSQENRSRNQCFGLKCFGIPCLRVALIVALVATTACSLVSGPQQLPPLPLLPPAELGKNLQLSQRVSVTFEGESRTFLGAWVVNTERLDFVGLTPSGQRLLTLSYDGTEFAESYSPLLEEALPGREVLSHLQLAHWPQASIERGLKTTDWRLEYAEGERHLYFNNSLILSIAASYTESGDNTLPAAIRIRSHVAPYRLEVETLQAVEK